jgi:proton-translocating NADH-quinone oxidoreductase chain M
MYHIIQYLEFILFIVPLLNMSVIGFIPKGKIQFLRLSSLFFSFFYFISFLFLWLFFYKNNISLYLNYSCYNIIFNYEINGTNILFLILTSFLISITILISWQWLPKFYSIRFYFYLIFTIEFISFNFFTINNLLFFYIFFESVLIPMYFLLGIWGLRPRRIHAAYQFFIYTFTGSLLMLISILYLNSKGLDYNIINQLKFLHLNLSKIELNLIWFSFFLAFAVKTPLIPFHIWLPEAHVEAPTAGSVILAGLLLKYGTFGFYKILILNMERGLDTFFWLVCCLSIISIIYGSLITYIQIDFKKIIAYSSVSHMGYVILGLIIKTPESICGSLLMMLTHGFISSGLFFIVGILYERYGTRNIFDYGGLKNTMPIFVFYFFILTLANMNLPLTCGFVSEFLIMLSLSNLNSPLILLLAALGIFTNGVYSIWLFNRICFGKNLFFKFGRIEYMDIENREHFILFFFTFFIFFIGIFPNLFLKTFELDLLYTLVNA